MQTHGTRTGCVGFLSFSLELTGPLTLALKDSLPCNKKKPNQQYGFPLARPSAWSLGSLSSEPGCRYLYALGQSLALPRLQLPHLSGEGAGLDGL